MPRKVHTAKIRFFLKKSISQPFLNFLNSNYLKISYFLTYFDNLMRKMGVTYDNFSSQILSFLKRESFKKSLLKKERKIIVSNIHFSNQIIKICKEIRYFEEIWVQKIQKRLRYRLFKKNLKKSISQPFLHILSSNFPQISFLWYIFII